MIGSLYYTPNIEGNEDTQWLRIDPPLTTIRLKFLIFFKDGHSQHQGANNATDIENKSSTTSIESDSGNPNRSI